MTPRFPCRLPWKLDLQRDAWTCEHGPYRIELTPLEKLDEKNVWWMKLTREVNIEPERQGSGRIEARHLITDTETAGDPKIDLLIDCENHLRLWMEGEVSLHQDLLKPLLAPR